MRPAPILCYRCGQPGHVDWVEVTTFGDAEPRYVRGRDAYCLTPGCADEDGSRRLEALTPEQMAAKADDAWFARHKAFVVDR